MKRMMRLLARNLYYYRVDYIRTLLISRLFQLFIVVPLVSLLFTLLLDLLNINTITEQNLITMLGHPLTIAMLALIALIILLFIYYEMGFLMLLAYHQQRAIPYTWKSLWKRLNQKVLYFLNLQTVVLVFYLLLIIPLISSVLPVSILQDLQIPHFIVDELLASTKGTIMYVSVIVVLLLINLRFIFMLPFFTIYQWTSIWQAMIMSWHFSKRRLIEVLGMLAFIIIMYASVVATLLVLAFTPLYFIERIMPQWGIVTAAVTLTIVQGVLVISFTFLQAIFSQILVFVAFYLTHDKPLIEQPESFRKTILHTTIVVGLYTFFLMIGSNLVNLEKNIYSPDTYVIAHRGFMERGVENTMSSIEASAQAGADMIEIDIQQTKDGQFVVFHDANLSRLAGRSESVYDLTLEELTQITVRAGGLSDQIPSLGAVLAQSKELGVKLLIEIKTHGHETPDFLDLFIQQLAEANVLDVHYIQSLDSELMLTLEDKEPRLITGLVYAMAMGSIPETDADFVAIEQFFASGRLIDQAQKMDKEIFVWTVNKDRSLQKFYELKVDGIITNHPDIAASLRELFSQDEFFMRRVLNKMNVIF
ncbi:MAG: glycerophosphodiester phosphodiesterase [Solibacillus sp.]